MSRLLSALLLLATVLWVGPLTASAQTPEETAAARDAYAKGQKLFREGDYQGAQSSFEVAYQAVPNPIVLLGIGEAQQRLGLWTDAVMTLSRYLKERPDAPDRAQVEAQLEKIRERPGELRVESTPPGAVVSVDGEDSGLVTPATLELAAGDHRIALSGPAGETSEEVVTILFGGKHSVSVDLGAGSVAVQAEEQGTVDEEPVAEDDGKSDRVRTAAWVSVGIAGGGLVMGSVLGGLALKERKKFDDNPTTESADRGEAYAIFADVGFGIAIAGALTAVVLFVTDDEDPDEQASAWQVAPLVGRNGGGLAGAVRF